MERSVGMTLAVQSGCFVTSSPNMSTYLRELASDVGTLQQKPYGLTPEEAAVQFFEYCADPKTQDHAITLLKRWKEEQEAQERNSTNAK